MRFNYLNFMTRKSDATSRAVSKLAWKRLTCWVLAVQVLGFLISGLLLGYSPLAELDSLSAIEMQARRFATVDVADLCAKGRQG